MDSQKGFITKFGELIDDHRAERRDKSTEKETILVTTASRGGWHRWIPSPGNVIFTLVMIGLLVAAQSVGALPLPAALRAPSATSTGTIAYQGRLADSSGAPLTGTYNMIFRLYDAASGGAPLWEEQWTGSNGVHVSDGLFNVMLGSLTTMPQDIIAGHDQLFLGITVGTDDEMAPRVQLGSVPFAVQALTVPNGSMTTAKIADGAVTSRKLRPIIEKVSAPTTLTLVATDQVLANATVTVDVPSSIWVIATCDCQSDLGGLIRAHIVVDGQYPMDQGSFFGGWDANLGGSREAISKSYVFDLEPGSHAVALQVRLHNGVGGGTAYADHSGFSYLVVAR